MVRLHRCRMSNRFSLALRPRRQASNARTESDAFWGPFGSVAATAVERSGNAEETQTAPFGRQHRTYWKGGERGMARDRATIVIVVGRLVLGAWTRMLHRILCLSHRLLCCQALGRCDRGAGRQRDCGLPVVGGMTGVRRRRSSEEETSHHGERQSSQQPRNGIDPRHRRRIEPRRRPCQSR